MSFGEAETVLQAVHGTSGVETQREILNGHGAGDAERVRISVLCREANVTSIMNILLASGTGFSYLECMSLAKLPSLGFGMGRISRLNPPVELETTITHIKNHLGLQQVQLAQAEGVKEILTVAVCAGSGSSVLRGVKADLYLTGEMSHHEILDAVFRSTHVILCNHSNSERGFLQVIQSRLSDLLGGQVKVIVSQRDKRSSVVV